jgi:hypothetical protein
VSFYDGFLLGGGIGFFSYEYGIAATGVYSFEVCITTGNQEYFESDLYSLSWQMVVSYPRVQLSTRIFSGHSEEVVTPSQF